MLNKMKVLLLILCLPLMGACVKDQQAARTRLPGVDRPPDKQEEPTPEKLPKEEPPPSRYG